MTLLVLLVVWFALSVVVALACGAFIRAGQGPRPEKPVQLLPELEDRSDADEDPLGTSSEPLEDLAA